MAAEVVLPVNGDLRAWDAAIRAARWTVFVDAETRIRDVQLVQRRFALKRRDAGTDRVLLVLADTRFHRYLIQSLGTSLVDGALPARDYLAALAAGRDPGGPGLILL